MNIREIEPSDGFVLRDLRLAALQESPQAFGATFEEESRLSDADWRRLAKRWSDDPDTCFMFCQHNDEYIGMAGIVIQKENPAVGVIYSVWLRPSHRGKLYAPKMLAKMETWARQKNIERLEGFVTEHNLPARAFYRKMGFCETNTRIKLRWDHSVEEILIQKVYP